jgi:hypothetical protein
MCKKNEQQQKKKGVENSMAFAGFSGSSYNAIKTAETRRNVKVQIEGEYSKEANLLSDCQLHLNAQGIFETLPFCWRRHKHGPKRTQNQK